MKHGRASGHPTHGSAPASRSRQIIAHKPKATARARNGMDSVARLVEIAVAERRTNSLAKISRPRYQRVFDNQTSMKQFTTSSRKQGRAALMPSVGWAAPQLL